ncbi:unnamed protein product, partial [Citrullus colocynthis]
MHDSKNFEKTRDTTRGSDKPLDSTKKDGQGVEQTSTRARMPDAFRSPQKVPEETQQRQRRLE